MGMYLGKEEESAQEEIKVLGLLLETQNLLCPAFQHLIQLQTYTRRDEMFFC